MLMYTTGLMVSCFTSIRFYTNKYASWSVQFQAICSPNTVTYSNRILHNLAMNCGLPRWSRHLALLPISCHVTSPQVASQVFQKQQMHTPIASEALHSTYPEMPASPLHSPHMPAYPSIPPLSNTTITLNQYSTSQPTHYRSHRYKISSALEKKIRT